MKIVTNNGVYLQKKDLELIFETTENNLIPNALIEKYKENMQTRDLDFIFFENKEVINFLNSFSFVINFNDYINLNWSELIDYYFDDLQKLRKMRVENDKNKFLSENKVYDNFLTYWKDKMDYFNYIPSKNEIKNYPLEMQLIYNKVTDIFEIRSFNCGLSDMQVPEDVFKPVRYGKKQLKQIYYEVLSEELSFEELKPYEKQLYCIFSRINYTPELLNIIRKIMFINTNNSIDFINDDLLDLILHIRGKENKFEQSTMYLIDFIYAIGYNKFENFDSRIILENDIKIIKNVINFIAGEKLSEKVINKLSQHNYELAEIIKVLKACNYSPYDPKLLSDIFSNMIAYVYMNPNAINNDYNFLVYAHKYITNNLSKIIKFMGYDQKKTDGCNQQFVDEFNRANSLLGYLYKQEYTKGEKKNKDKEI